MSMAAEMENLTAGELANNGMFVQGLQKLLMGSEYNLEVLVKSIKDMEINGSWRAFTFHKCPKQVFRWNAADFRKFIEADRPAGCQTKVHVLRRLLQGTDAAETLEKLTRGKPGNPTGANQYTETETGNHDNVTDSSPRSQRDYSREAPTGNSSSYALRCLERKRPDLYEQVKRGEKTANAAMVEAGFREKAITIPASRQKAGSLLAKHFTRKQFSELVDAALDYYRSGGEV